MTQSQMTDEIKLISAQLTDSTSRDERKSLTYKLSNLVFDQGYRQGNIDGYHSLSLYCILKIFHHRKHILF